MKTTVLVTRSEVEGTYRIVVGNNIWYDCLKKEQVFSAMEDVSIELGNDGVEHVFKFEMF